MISFDEFKKVEIKIGEIKSAERIPGSDKLLKMKIDLGGAQKTCVAGIAQHYKPEELVGKEIALVVNMEPRSLRGVTSEVMLLAAVEKEGKVVILTPEKRVKPGSEVT